MSFLPGISKSSAAAHSSELQSRGPGLYTFPSTGTENTSNDTGGGLSHKPSQEPLLQPNAQLRDIRVAPSPTNYLYDWWLWEIVSIFVSAICMPGISLVLFVFHDKTIPSLPAGLTMNALVSLLATLSKAAMLVTVAACISQLKWHWFNCSRKMGDFELFEQASRGPWGAMCLILKTRSPWLVGLGAVISIVALGVEPFMQQIISFKVIPTGMPAPATISRAQTYDARASLSDFAGGLQKGPDLGIKAALYRGMFTPTTPMEVLPVCVSGNCTFPIFDSLAFCSECRNVTDQTQMTHESRGKGDGLGPGGRADEQRNYTYTFPGNYNITASGYFYVGGSRDSLSSGPAMLSKGDMPEAVARSQLGVANPITALAILQFPEVDRAGYGGDYSNQTPRAWQCALYFCLKTYNVTVINGVTNSTILSSWHSDIGTPLPIIEKLSDYGATADAMLTRPKESPVTVIKNASFPLSGSTVAAMASYLNHTLSGIQLSRTAEVFYDTWTNDVTQALTETTDIAAMMSGVATSLTKYIRESDTRGLGTVGGTSFKTEVRVRVRWAWITLPVTLVILSVTFLVATMVRVAHDGLPVWKTSSLAALFHGFEHGSSEGVLQPAPTADEKAPSKLRDMNILAETMDVRLKYVDAGGWKLAPVKDSI